MPNPEMPSHDPRRVEEPRPSPKPETEQAGAPASALFVDPYDMRLEPQPEEPGYGHGV